jgi:succinoglycan biosynthesis protein ExoA
LDDTLPFLSVIMPVRNEAKYIRRSLEAVLAQDYPPDLMEVIVTDGMSDDGTRDILLDIQAQDPRVTVRNCVRHLLEDGVDGVGGSVETVGETGTAVAIAAAMSSSFGVGGSAFRTVKDRTMLADTIPFPAYTRCIVEKAGPYDETLVRDQDDEYNYRIRKLGGRLLLAGDVRSRYYSRATLASLWRQYFGYGLYKVQVLRKHPRQMKARQLVPGAFVACLAAGVALSPFSSRARRLLALVVAAYGTANGFASWRTASQTERRNLATLPAAFAVMHLGYGAGFIAGIGRTLTRDRSV